jgi:hypothetical protein
MPTAVQRELFPDAKATSMLERIRRSMATRELVSASEVAVACDLSMNSIYALIESGDIEGVNVAAEGHRAYYRIFAPSVVRFFERRLGVEDRRAPNGR